MKRFLISLLALVLCAPVVALAQVSSAGGVPASGQAACFPWPNTGQIAPCVASTGNAVREVTAAGTVTVSATTDFIVVINKTTGAATAVTLPACVAGQRFIIKDGKGDAATNAITITPTSATIDNSATLVINTAYGTASLACVGTQWRRL